jgi:tetratricopeptide (TPR) repeat protein
MGRPGRGPETGFPLSTADRHQLRRRHLKVENHSSMESREADMKRKLTWIAFSALFAALCVPAALAQSTGSVKGVCRDMQGNPIVGATVQWVSQENGRKYELKTNKKGEYFSLGIEPGKYTVTLLQDGKQLDLVKGFPVQLDENTLDFDLKKSQQQAAQQQGISPEQLKQMQEQQAKQAKEVTTVKALNEKLAAANQASQAGDFDGAITQLTDATNMDATRDLLWFKLGDAYRNSAVKQTDAGEKSKRLDQAQQDYQKAIDIKQKAVEASTTKNPADAQTLASYYNNLAEAYARAGKTDDAVKAYGQAAQTNPTGAGQYYFNLGAILTNTGKVDDAIAAFDKAIAADPNRADAYYWKGVNMMGKATLKGDKMVAPDGTADAFNKYLQLQPNGQFADPAKQMLASIGAAVETEYGKKKGAARK